MEKEERVLRPSLLSADFTCLEKEIDEMVKLGIKDCHFDVMDGSFVDEISFGEPVFRSLVSKYKDKIDFDVHLMTLNPEKQIRLFYDCGAREICFHYETFSKDTSSILKMKEQMPGLRLGIAFSPESDVHDVLPYLHLFSFVLVMSVVPGKGGQSYIPHSEDKIAVLDEYRKKNVLPYLIGVDGGINKETSSLVYHSHVDWMVCGSYYFKAEDKKKLLSEFRNSIGGF